MEGKTGAVMQFSAPRQCESFWRFLKTLEPQRTWDLNRQSFDDWPLTFSHSFPSLVFPSNPLLGVAPTALGSTVDMRRQRKAPGKVYLPSKAHLKGDNLMDVVASAFSIHNLYGILCGRVQIHNECGVKVRQLGRLSAPPELSGVVSLRSYLCLWTVTLIRQLLTEQRCAFFFFRSFVFLDAVGGYHRRPPGPRLSQFLSKNKKKNMWTRCPSTRLASRSSDSSTHDRANKRGFTVVTHSAPQLHFK